MFWNEKLHKVIPFYSHYASPKASPFTETYSLKNCFFTSTLNFTIETTRYSVANIMSISSQPIVIIVGTNRPNSMSRKIAEYYQNLLSKLNAPSLILDLVNLPHDFTVSAMYENSGKNEGFNGLRALLEKTDKFVFIVPEYNGSYPGVLKAFIDGLPYPNSFTNKKAALVGLSSNTQGATIAMSHLNDVFSYLGMNTLALRVKLAQIRNHYTEGVITNALYNELLEMQAEQILRF
jgi:chromate reductase